MKDMKARIIYAILEFICVFMLCIVAYAQDLLAPVYCPDPEHVSWAPEQLQAHAQIVIRGSKPELAHQEKATDSFEVPALEIPKVDTAVKTYMDYQTITNKKSSQWKLQQKAKTDKNGLRVIDGKYLVAMGTYYSDHTGAMFRVTLKNGTKFDAIIGDIKDDKDTDSKNQHRNGNVVEFIVDRKKMPRDSRLMGDVSYTPGAGLMGPIQSIEKIGEYEF